MTSIPGQDECPIPPQYRRIPSKPKQLNPPRKQADHLTHLIRLSCYNSERSLSELNKICEERVAADPHIVDMKINLLGRGIWFVKKSPKSKEQLEKEELQYQAALSRYNAHLEEYPKKMKEYEYAVKMHKEWEAYRSEKRRKDAIRVLQKQAQNMGFKLIREDEQFGEKTITL
jgi:hypothetical protein